MNHILAADIGGTNARFAHFRYGPDKQLELVSTVWLKTGDADSFVDLLGRLDAEQFSLSLAGAHAAVFAVAGPVEEGRRSRPAYIPWPIDLGTLERDIGVDQPLNAMLINDFAAQAYACRTPAVAGAKEILSGRVEHTAPLAVIGAGTALGQAALVPDGCGGHIAVPSEGGHSGFAFENDDEMEYRDFLLREVGGPYVMALTVVSGRGLSLLHQHLTGHKLEPAQVAETLDGEGAKTLEMMSRFYGRACRNYALQVLATGGVYIAGGVAARIPRLITCPHFAREFHRSETMLELLGRMPVFLNDNQDSGLWGAAAAAVQFLLNA